MRRRWWVSAAGFVSASIALFGTRSLVHAPALDAVERPAAPKTRPTVAALDPPPATALEEGEEEAPRGFRLPSGEPSAVSCEAARAIVAQVRHSLAYEPEPVLSRPFADATADWLDPHGLWSAAPDAPIQAVLARRSKQLLVELEGRGRDCSAAREAGAALVTWIGDLRRAFDRERAVEADSDLADSASDGLFETGAVTRPARVLAGSLGRRVGAVERLLGAKGGEFGRVARERYFPNLDAEGWSRVVLAAAVRAYVPLVDPHGAWAPRDEEASVYEVDLEAHPPSRLWDKSTRTAVGLRIDSGAAAPLRDGDVVLSLGGVPTAGLPLEQIEQLAYAVAESPTSSEATVLRPGETAPLTLSIVIAESEAVAAGRTGGAAAGASAGEKASELGRDELAVERVRYATGDAIVVSIRDVRDDLGDELTRAILRERARGPDLVGVVLDLRGNGGGSTDGAVAALGIFLPGATLFPMKRRDGTIETDRAPEPPLVDRWGGPVATLVDAETASAAEMIAGALSSYRRGPSVGTVTFGKGCAQEYLEDDVRAGVLRLTTLLYALPDGSPVQRIGLTPTIRLPFGPPLAPRGEREATLSHAPPTWRGPDVRDPMVLRRVAEGAWGTTWPPHAGQVGPCREPDVCRALRALGNPPPSKRIAAVKSR
jgi:carboxyl-terminal processing protease